MPLGRVADCFGTGWRNQSESGGGLDRNLHSRDKMGTKALHEHVTAEVLKGGDRVVLAETSCQNQSAENTGRYRCYPSIYISSCLSI